MEKSLISLETREHTCAHAYVNEYSHGPCGFLETGWESTELHKHPVRISQLFSGFSQHHAERKAQERGSPTQDSSGRTQLGQNPESTETHSTQSPPNN